jgi:hypothetical protein
MKKIYFEDKGQDALWWIINKKGVVIDCNLQLWKWKGCLVLDPQTIKEGDNLRYFSQKGKFSFKYPVIKVLDLVEMGEQIAEMVADLNQDSKAETIDIVVKDESVISGVTADAIADLKLKYDSFIVEVSEENEELKIRVQKLEAILKVCRPNIDIEHELTLDWEA